MTLLTACSMNFTPEQAFVSELINPNRPGKKVNSESIVILQRVEFGETFYLLAKYQASEDGRLWDCLDSYEMVRRLGSWHTGGGGGGCSSGPDQPPLVEVGQGISTKNNRSVSNVYGLVHHEDIIVIDITWQDDLAQQVQVVNGSYIAIREEAVMVKYLKASNAQDEILYTYEEPEDRGKP
jgi:hypothetical protein